MTEHAKNRPPSSAKRWLACPYSSQIVRMYQQDETEQSLKGDLWHKAMETQLQFGCVSADADPDMADAMSDLLEYVKRRREEMGGAALYVEQRLDIPETGEFGTVDIALVAVLEMEVIDLKSGYVPVKVGRNEQIQLYMLGLIAKFGERPKYRGTIHQPNYDHADGAIRSWDFDAAQIAEIRQQIKFTDNFPDDVEAGEHCKETYCPHRGACTKFHTYIQDELSLGYHPSEVKGISDHELSQALDSADQLSGYRNELRAEAMRRIITMDRRINGYKVVKGRRQRAVKDKNELITSIRDILGVEWAVKLFPELAWYGDRLNSELFPGELRHAQHIQDALGTPKHIEDVIKQYARQYRLPRGGWQGVYDNVARPYISETAEGLTLEKAIDGRPAHKRGSEFGEIPASEGAKGLSII